ncbi:ferredoxin III, nif-specific [Halorhodospira abdelmalekii]|uniref:ferredoxin III, nif-specific n=1 Tax=Halorhodospira abdelmalekii TaxID=421629 RepID=UPI0019051F11|nr:ferredoxin III, nif-specific [Halorhodospira abdelmalekii]MBK1733855.1 ferredoxin III, nif-specific [Halorhodospira abdelmalekii]
MSAYLEGYRKDGTTWVPEFITALSSDICIGCGRCFKACTQSVLDLVEEEDEDEDDEIRMYMTIASDGSCIGCKACAAACPKECFEHAPLAVE